MKQHSGQGFGGPVGLGSLRASRKKDRWMKNR